jgi:hypothetical protein
VVRDPGGSGQSSWRGTCLRHRRRIVLALAALLLSVAGVLEFGFEIRVPWLAMIFWVAAGVAVIIACSGLGEVRSDRF